MPKKQSELPGVEAPSIPEIEEAADKYVQVRDKRMKLTEQEIAARTTLIQTLHAHQDELEPSGEDGKLWYRYDDQVITLEHQDKVKVRTAHAETEEDEE